MQLACKRRSIANLLGKREEDKVEEQEDANFDFLLFSHVWWRSRWKAIILFIWLSQVDRMMVQLVRKRKWLAQIVFEFQTRQSDLDKDQISSQLCDRTTAVQQTKRWICWRKRCPQPVHDMVHLCEGSAMQCTFQIWRPWTSTPFPCANCAAALVYNSIQFPKVAAAETHLTTSKPAPFIFRLHPCHHLQADNL